MYENIEKILAFGWELLFDRMRREGFTSEQIKQVMHVAVAEMERIESDPTRPKDVRRSNPEGNDLQ